MKNVWISVLVVLIFVGAFFGAYSVLIKGNTQKSLTSEVTPSVTLVGSDRDEYGCIPSAGYLWCSAKQRCLREWEEKCELTPPVSPDEREIIVSDVTKALSEKSTSKNPKVTVSLVEGNYAKGMANFEEGDGGIWFAVKESSKWKLIWDGNGIITCSEISGYKIPVTLLPQCFDTEKNFIIDR